MERSHRRVAAGSPTFQLRLQELEGLSAVSESHHVEEPMSYTNRHYHFCPDYLTGIL